MSLFQRVKLAFAILWFGEIALDGILEESVCETLALLKENQPREWEDVSVVGWFDQQKRNTEQRKREAFDLSVGKYPGWREEALRRERGQ